MIKKIIISRKYKLVLVVLLLLVSLLGYFFFSKNVKSKERIITPSTGGLYFYSNRSLGLRRDDESVLSSYGSHFGTKVYKKDNVGFDEIVLFEGQEGPLPLLKEPLIMRIYLNQKRIYPHTVKIEYLSSGYIKTMGFADLTVVNSVQFVSTNKLVNKIDLKCVGNGCSGYYSFELLSYGFFEKPTLFILNKNSVAPCVEKYCPVAIKLDDHFPTPYREQDYVRSVLGKKFSFSGEMHFTNEVTVPTQEKQLGGSYDEQFKLRGDVIDKISRETYPLIANAVRTLENSLWEPFGSYKNRQNSYVSVSTKYGYPLIIPWDSAFNALGYSRILSSGQIPQGIIDTILKNECPNGMVPNVIFENSSKNTCDRSNPPILGWVSAEIYKKYGDKEFIETIYPLLEKTLTFWEISRDKNKNGLFEYDSEEKISKRDRYQLTLYETAWDDNTKYIPDFNGGYLPYEIESLELCSLLYKEYLSMSYMAEELGNFDKSRFYQDKANKLKNKINDLMYDDNLKSYFDLSLSSGEKIHYFTPHIFLPLFSGIASKDQADAIINKYLLDESLFWPSVPTVGYSQYGYTDDGSFYGPTWLQVYYFVYQGVKNYSVDGRYDSVLSDMRDFLIRLHEHNNYVFFEKYNSNPQSYDYMRGLGKVNYGWSAAVSIKIFLDE